MIDKSNQVCYYDHDNDFMATSEQSWDAGSDSKEEGVGHERTGIEGSGEDRSLILATFLEKLEVMSVSE